MTEQPIPKGFKFEWSTYQRLSENPLTELGIKPSAIGTSGVGRPPLELFETLLGSGAPRIEIVESLGERGFQIPKWAAERIRELAKINKVRVSLHAPPNLTDISTMKEDQLKNILHKELETAVDLVMSPKEKKGDPREVLEKAKKGLVNLHGNIGTQLGLFKVKPEMGGVPAPYIEYSQPYLIARKTPTGEYEITRLEGRPLAAYSDELLSIYFPEKKKEIEEELRKLKEDYEAGKIRFDEYLNKKDKILKEMDKWARKALQLHADTEVTSLYLRMKELEEDIGERAKDIAETMGQIERIRKQIEQTTDPDERRRLEELLIQNQKKLRDLLRRSKGGILMRDLGRSISSIAFLQSSLSQLSEAFEKPKKIEREEIKKEIENLYGIKIKELGERLKERGLITERGLQKISEALADVKEELAKRFGMGVKANVLSAEEFLAENTARKLSRVLADFFVKKGYMPTVCLENVQVPWYDGDIRFLTKVIKKTREYFVEEVMKRRDKLEEKGLSLSKEELKKLAKDTIGLTLDTSHLWFWRDYGKSDEEILKDLEYALKEGVVRHIHAVDTIPGLGHLHLVPGEGTLDWKKIIKKIKEAIKEGKVPEDVSFILEPGTTVSELAGLARLPGAQAMGIRESELAGYTYAAAVYPWAMQAGPVSPYIGTEPYPIASEYFGWGPEASYFEEVKKR